MVTLKQIAELAGVSRGTVDRSLNNRGGVDPEVDKRIKTLAKELNYSPNRAGRALAIRKKQPKFGVVLCSIGNMFFTDVIKGIKKAEEELADYGIKVLINEIKGYNLEDQIKAIDELVSEDIKCLALMPIDDKSITKKIKDLMLENMPVVTINTDIENSERLAYIGCDYFLSGKTAAGLASFMMNENSKVLIVTGSSKNKGHNQRIEGFKMVMDERCNSAEIIDVVENNDDDITSYIVTFDTLNKHKDVDLIYVTSAGVSGVVRAVAKIGRKINIISCDETNDIIKYVEAGNITATICQQPFLQGYKAIYALFDYIVNDVKPPEKILTACEIKIKENIT